MEQNVTKNITAKDEILEVLQKYFPQCFDKNNNFNFEKFKKELQLQDVIFSKESYTLDWLGKSYARLLATDPATTLLKEDKEWNSKKENRESQNLLIRGDNLEVLKHLSNAYYNKIKIIYIDPPYNTENDNFIYQDDRKFTVDELAKLAGIDEEKAKRILDFVNSKSNSHSAWLTFMYPRLYIARRLLKDDGAIFVSIDENELAQLRILMDEIFGEENFVALVPRKTGAGAAATRSDSELRKLNDYVLIYKKNKLVFKKKIVGEKTYPYVDEKGRYNLVPFQASGSDATRSARPNMYYPIYLLPDGTLTTKENKNAIKTILPNKVNGEDGRWLWSAKKFEEDIELICYENGKLQKKDYFDPSKDNKKYQVEKAWFDQFPNPSGTKRLNDLFEPLKGLFNNPKPVELIKFLINLIKTTENEEIIILDYFAGSGTTGDAVMQLNAEDGGNRKYILVQIPEPIDPDKKKVAYDFVKNELGVEKPTIFEITKERLVRAARKIKEEIIENKMAKIEAEIKKLEAQLDEDNKEEINRLRKELDALKSQDLGFKIFETTPIWEDYEFKAEVFEPQLNMFDEGKLTEEDIQMLLTTWKTYDGVLLTQDLNEIDLDGYTGYYFDNKIYLMFRGFEIKHLKKLLEKIDADKDFNPSTIIVFGYNFDSKTLREISENVSSYTNKKGIDIEFIIRY
ncbi:DNA methyltransferase [Geobacillus stearothermophilus]|uniref:site-specific DNA-methyltransferase n=1 Tax=Geobacillus TaxID=129337 RepID=UPI002E1CC8D2|nr:DNA methyltransferase [Geobacillus thermodenitrificans]MED3719183.1 DNA methyltransferase [Geobacillus thermodenitrificans]